MTRLTIHDAAAPARVLLDTGDFSVISREVAALGAGIERWQAAHELADEAGQQEILSAYEAEIERLKSLRHYQSADVVSIRPGHPDWTALRRKFLSEHTHDEDEVRFFVMGSGAFYLHLGGKVHRIVCERGDLIYVPRGTPHWFDGGPVGNFTCIRLFTRTDGWIAEFTGSRISETVPTYDSAA